MPTSDSVFEQALRTQDRIRTANPSIYDPPVDATSDLYYSVSELELLIARHLEEHLDALCGLPVRTRSKVAKGLICDALGYETPRSFTKTQPRFPHPNLDVAVQSANNLQLWNQEIDPARRYVVILTDSDGRFRSVKVIPGSDLAQYDTTGVLTRKYQASRLITRAGSHLVSLIDTPRFVELLDPQPRPLNLPNTSPTDPPTPGAVLTIQAVFEALEPMVGTRFNDPGITQERNRGTLVHREACARMGLGQFADNGQFPDVLCQAVEVKLQLARTVDLGLELPNSRQPLASLGGTLAACDVRFAVFYAERLGSEFELSSLVVTTGADFFTEFRQFGGNVQNAKYQLRLPNEWFA